MLEEPINLHSIHTIPDHDGTPIMAIVYLQGEKAIVAVGGASSGTAMIGGAASLMRTVRIKGVRRAELNMRKGRIALPFNGRAA